MRNLTPIWTVSAIVCLLALSGACTAIKSNGHQKDGAREQLLLTLDSPNENMTGARIRGGRLLYFTNEGHLVCVGLTEGRLLWKLTGVVVDQPSLLYGPDEQILLGTRAGELVIVNERTGEIDNRWRIGEGPVSLRGVSGSTVLLTEGVGTLFAFDINIGKPLWKMPQEQNPQIATAVFCQGNWLCFFNQWFRPGEGQFGILALAAKDGAIMWKRQWQYREAIPLSPTLGCIGKAAFLTIQFVDSDQMSTALIALDCETGLQIWQTHALVSIIKPAIDEDTLLFEYRSPIKLVSFDWPTRSERWSMTPSFPDSHVLMGALFLSLSEGRVLYQTGDDKELFEVSSADGRIVRRISSGRVLAAALYKGSCYFLKASDLSIWVARP